MTRSPSTMHAQLASHAERPHWGAETISMEAQLGVIAGFADLAVL